MGCGSRSSKSSSQKTIQPSQISAREALANGQRQYHLRGCQKCHGTLGDGKGTRAGRYPPDKLPRDFKDLTSYQQGYELEGVIYTLRNGVSDPESLMPKFPFLVDEEVAHIAQYVVFLRTNEVMRKPASLKSEVVN